MVMAGNPDHDRSWFVRPVKTPTLRPRHIPLEQHLRNYNYKPLGVLPAGLDDIVRAGRSERLTGSGLDVSRDAVGGQWRRSLPAVGLDA